MAVDVSGRVALVTNAGTEAGRAVALALAASGAAVCVHDTNPNRADQVVDAIHADGGRAMPWVGDISNRFQVAAMIEALRDELGGLHILVNVASTDKRAPLLALDEYDWRRVLDLNLTGAFFCTQLAARVMVDDNQDGGVIVNVGSCAAPEAGSTAYAVSQAGLIGFTRAAAQELSAQGVRVNAVCSAQVPPGQTQRSHEIAAVVLFLCSDAAAAITGQVLPVSERVV